MGHFWFTKVSFQLFTHEMGSICQKTRKHYYKDMLIKSSEFFLGALSH